jgi:hypothetical protein
MIVFDLACGGGHVFEAWFGSSGDYEDQKARGLVSCPICGDAGIDKAVMAPRIPAKGNQRQEVVPVASPGPPADPKALLAALAAAQAKVLEGSDYVGPRFAAEARSMHLGETDHRPIHGQATAEEAKALIDDGVPVAPLPLPVRPPGADN